MNKILKEQSRWGIRCFSKSRVLLAEGSRGVTATTFNVGWQRGESRCLRPIGVWQIDTHPLHQPAGGASGRAGGPDRGADHRASEPGRVRRGEGLWRVEPDGPDELVELAGAFNQMADSLEQADEQVFINFSHSNWAEQSSLCSHCSTKWAVFLLSLKNALEKGEGKPYPDDIHIDHDE